MISQSTSMDIFGDIGREWRKNYINAFSKKRVLVAGATGLIGGHLARTLVDLGGEVYGLGRTASADTLPPNVKPVTADLTRLQEAESAVEQVKADIIVHLAHLVLTGPDISAVLPTMEQNIIGSVNFLLAAKKIGCQRMLFSNFPQESVQLSNGNVPISPYCASKTAATAFARMFHYLYGLPVIIVNPYYTYGPMAKPEKMIPTVIRAFLNHEAPKITTGEQYIEPVFVDDCIRGLVVAALGPERLLGQTLDFMSGTARKVRDVVNDIKQIMGVDIEPVFGAKPQRHGDKDMTVPPGTLERTTHLCGWKPLWSWEEGLAFTIDWLKNNPF